MTNLLEGLDGHGGPPFAWFLYHGYRGRKL